ncbi:hypothetical protein DZB84_18460 [Bacillus sp. HNG]|uniref:hypothetical protein n=1 Tax=Bacillus sp. HNG TaxID=2293325 RepID=UPI000E2F31C0|nr:hypothetical protein [Bacillus sp. HNG]RFB12734.1 hypothetical protein DZB84_18460 [Bacillus sp. HNG]
MKPQTHSNQTSYQDFNLIYEGMKKRGIYLLEYHDQYLKDAFVNQLYEQFINKGSHVLIVQKEQPPFSMKDIILSRMLFRQNPHNFTSIAEIEHEAIESLSSSFQSQVESHITNTEIVSSPSEQPHDCLQLISQSLDQNPEMKFVIWDSHTDYFHSSNLIPVLSRITFKYKIPFLITSKISTEKFFNKGVFLPAYLPFSLYLHSDHPNLFSRSDLKDVAYEFQLDVRTTSNKQLRSYFTFRPASAYCQEG